MTEPDVQTAELTIRFPACDLPTMRTLVRAIDDAKEREARAHRARALAVEHDRTYLINVPEDRLKLAADLGFMLLGPLREATS